jgi:predicted oxidoreductase
MVGTQDLAHSRLSAEALEVELGRADIFAILTAARGAPLP